MAFSPKHILVPVALDAGDELMLAEQAVFTACDIAEKFLASITLLHLVPLTSPGAASIDVSGQIYQSFLRSLNERLERGKIKLKEWQDQGKDRGIKIETRVIDSVDDTAAVILDSAKSLNADLLVIGSHGRSGLSRVLFGSVAVKVADLSTVPVLLLHPNKNEKK